MASLKGIKVDIADDNPYLKSKNSLEELPPQGLPRPPPPPPAPPVGPKMSYAEKLKLAKETKNDGAAASTPAAPPAAVAAPLPSPAPPVAPQAQEQASVVGAEAAADAPRRLLEQEVPEGALLGEDAARAKVSVTARGARIRLNFLLCWVSVWVSMIIACLTTFVIEVERRIGSSWEDGGICSRLSFGVFAPLFGRV